MVMHCNQLRLAGKSSVYVFGPSFEFNGILLPVKICLGGKLVNDIIGLCYISECQRNW